LSIGHDLIGSSLSPAAGSPVRVIANAREAGCGIAAAAAVVAAAAGVSRTTVLAGAQPGRLGIYQVGAGVRQAVSDAVPDAGGSLVGSNHRN
jgi:hypothetical protein